MKYNVSELEGALLDAAVAKCEGLQWVQVEHGTCTHQVTTQRFKPAGVSVRTDKIVRRQVYMPSSRWAQGGLILERHYNAIIHQLWLWFGSDWPKRINAVVSCDILVWYMRAYVASKHGETIELPWRDAS